MSVSARLKEHHQCIDSDNMSDNCNVCHHDAIMYFMLDGYNVLHTKHDFVYSKEESTAKCPS